MNFPYLAGFKALQFVGRPVPKTIDIFFDSFQNFFLKTQHSAYYVVHEERAHDKASSHEKAFHPSATFGEFFRGMPAAGHGKVCPAFYRRRKSINLIDNEMYVTTGTIFIGLNLEAHAR